MIKLKSFPLDRIEEANKFMLDNPPRSTEKQSGIIFHNGNIVIIYDDGKENPKEVTANINSSLEQKRREQALIQHRINVSNAALATLIPKGYISGISDTKLKDLFTKAGFSYDDSKKKIDEIFNLENEILMDNHEFRRVGFEITAYENELKPVKAKKNG